MFVKLTKEEGKPPNFSQNRLDMVLRRSEPASRGPGRAGEARVGHCGARLQGDSLVGAC